MVQEKQHLHPRRPRVTEPEPALQKRSVREVDDLNIDELLSKDAEEFLKRNKQKGGE